MLCPVVRLWRFRRALFVESSRSMSSIIFRSFDSKATSWEAKALKLPPVGPPVALPLKELPPQGSGFVANDPSRNLLGVLELARHLPRKHGKRRAHELLLIIVYVSEDDTGSPNV